MNRFLFPNAMLKYVLSGLLLCMPYSMLFAEPLVQCRVSSSGEELQPEFKPGNDPLSTSAFNLSNGFRFSGVLLQAPGKFKSYVYYESKDRYVLIARQEWLLDQKTCGKNLGRNEVYSSYLENHLSFECSYQCPE